MKKLALVGLAAVAVGGLALAGCSADAGPATLPPGKVKSFATSTPSSPKDSRGNLVKAIGQPAWETSQDGKATYVTFDVAKVDAPATCSSPYADKPEHGYFVRLVFSVVTASTAPQEYLSDLLNPTEFSTIGADGVTESDLSTLGTFMCDGDSLAEPHQFQAGSTYEFEVVLDTKSEHGSVVYAPYSGGGAGWSWSY